MDEVCRFCGESQAAHKVVDDGYGARQLKGPDGHLYEALHFPRSIHRWQPLALPRSFVMLTELKSADLPKLDSEQLIALSMFGKSLQDEYDVRHLEPPVWLQSRRDAVERAIFENIKAGLERDLASARKEEDALKSKDEKRSEVRARISRLELMIESLKVAR